MRKIPTASVATTMIIALYFALAWGIAGLQALMSPSFGLDDVWRSEGVFAINRFLNLEPTGLIRLAAFLAAVKTTAAAVCVWHLLERLRGRPRIEVLEGALIIVLGVNAMGGAAAFFTHSGALLGEQVVSSVLAAIGLALCMIERAREQKLAAAETTGEGAEGALAEGPYTPWPLS
jgi:hypothetical protein